MTHSISPLLLASTMTLGKLLNDSIGQVVGSTILLRYFRTKCAVVE